MYLRSIAAAAALAVVSCGTAYAGITSGTPFTVQVTVTAGCNITTDGSTVTFATTAGTAAAPADQTPSVAITCTNTTPYTIYFGSANTVTGNVNRIMTNGAQSIGYQIRHAGGTIGNTLATGWAPGNGTGSAQTWGLVFRITNWTPVTPNTYTDTVTMNVEF